MKIYILKKTLFLLFIFIPSSVFAQMFSIHEKQNRRSVDFSPYARTGIYFINFEFQGDPSAVNSQSDLTFTGTAAYFGYDANVLSFDLSYGNDLTQLENQRFFSFGLNFNNPFYLITGKNFGAGVPVKLRTKVTSVKNDGFREEFRQTDLSAGAGAILRVNIPEKLGLATEFIPSIGFSTASGGFIGGNIFSLSGKARINFYNILFGKNISLGYDFVYDSFDIDGEQFDYDVNGHLITIGVSL